MLNRQPGIIMSIHKCILRTSLLFGVVALLSSHSRAQRDTSSIIPFQNIWAMEFGVGSNLTLTSFLDADIAGSRYQANGSKIRIAVRLRANASKDEYDELEFRADTVYYTSDGLREYSWSSIALTLGYFGYSRQLQRVSMFWGAGPILSY